LPGTKQLQPPDYKNNTRGRQGETFDTMRVGAEPSINHKNLSMETANELHQYQWIVNEGLLRDEGTLYGIAGAGLDEKVEAIREYYRIKKAASLTKQEQVVKKMTDLCKDPQDSLVSAGGSTTLEQPPNLIPVLLQFFIYIGICFFNYSLERYWLAPVFTSAFICLGLYAFGLFSVFIGRSVMYNTAESLALQKGGGGQREQWKIYFEEFGVALVVALFITILPRKFYPLEYSIIAAVFFFMLFLFGGKGLVNTFFRARGEIGKHITHMRKSRKDKEKARGLDALQADLAVTTTTLEELAGEEQYRIKVFMSEYNLAFESRQLAAVKSIKKLA
jgi:hypothetical protein